MQDNIAKLTEKGIKVVGVSMDKAAAQKKFHAKHEFPFPLIADPEGAVVDAFGVKKLRIGLCARESFLVRDGKLIWIERKAKPADHAAVVLAALAEAAP